MNGGRPPGKKATRIRWLVFALAFATSWFLYLHRYTWGVIKPDVKETFGFDDTQLGILDSCFSISYALCQIPTGLLGDFFGPRAVLSTSIFAWSGLMATFVATGSLWSLGAVRALFGIAQAGTYPNLGKLTRAWYPRTIRTTVQGAVASFGGRAGGACAALIVSTLLMGQLGLSWQVTVTIIASLGIALALLFYLLVRNTPKEHPSTNEAERDLIGVEDPPDDNPGTKAKRKLRFSRIPAIRLSFAFMLAHIFLSAAADQLFVNWIPLFLSEEKGLGRLELGVYASLPLWAGAIGGMVGGTLNDLILRRTGRLRLARTVIGFTGKTIAGALVVLAIQFEDGRSMMLVIAAAKFFTDWSQPTMWGAVTDISGRAAATVFGTVNMVGSLGGVASNPTFGYVKQHYGWNTVFWLIAAVYVISAVCWFWVNTTRPLVVDDTVGEDSSSDVSR